MVSGYPLGVNLPTHSGDIQHCLGIVCAITTGDLKGSVAGIWWAEVRNATESPTTNNYIAGNVRVWVIKKPKFVVTQS